MKQNEKVLVYAVTGFLLVILGIAILFGKDGPRGPMTPTPQKQATAQNESKGIGDLFAELGKQAADADAEHGMGRPDDASLTGLKAPDESPLAAPPPPTPAEEVQLKLGDYRRDRDYRLVKAMPGDSLSALAQRWCGSAAMVEQVRSLNEGLQTLIAGQEVVMPWVEDTELLAALRERQAAAVARPTVGNGPAANGALSHGTSTTPAGDVPAPKGSDADTSAGSPAVASRLYKLQSGDKLWNIAVKAVGMKAAPAYLEQVKKLNPGIADINNIRAGQELRLPANG